MYKKKTEIAGMRHRTYYEEVPDKLDIRKGKIRDQIVKEISDRDDLIADCFKLSFLIVSAIKEIYKVIDTSKIPSDVKELLDSSFEKYEKTKTIMDLYLESKDYSFIDRMLKRQEEITKIVENSK